MPFKEVAIVKVKFSYKWTFFFFSFAEAGIYDADKFERGWRQDAYLYKNKEDIKLWTCANPQ